MSDSTLQQRERRALRHLFNGDFDSAEAKARTILEVEPLSAAGWTALRGALAARGQPADAEALRRQVPGAADQAGELVERIAAQRLSPRGLVFDVAERFPVRPMAEALEEVETAQALRSGSNVVWVLDRGGEMVERWPVLDLGGAAGPEFPWRYRTGPKFVASIANAAVVGEGLLLTQDGAFLEETHAPCDPSKYWSRREGDELTFEAANYERTRRGVKVFDTPAFLMAGPTDTSFGDWIVNFASRLALYEAAGLDCPILLRWKPPQQIPAILEAMGVPPERLIFHTTDQISLFPKIFAPCWPSADKLGPMAGVFDVYRRAALPPTAERPLLYLSRQGLGARPLVNENEVCELFASRGFRIVNLGELSFEEVRRLVASPACVAGPFGSAFHNLAFAGNQPPGLVLAPPHLPYNLQEIAQWNADWGSRFAYVLGEMPPRPHNWRTPWTVSLEKVERALDAMLALIGSEETAPAG